MRALSWIGLAITPLLVAVAAVMWVRLAGQAAAVAATAAVTPLVVALGVWPVAFALGRARAAVWCASCLAAAAGVSAWAAPAGTPVTSLALIAGLSLLVVAGITAPLAACGRKGLAAAAWFVAAGTACATPWLVSGAPGELPGWVFPWNPVARMLCAPLGVDWLHAPGLYGAVGTMYYRTPELAEGMGAPAAAAAVGFVSAVVIVLLRHQRAAKAAS